MVSERTTAPGPGEPSPTDPIRSAIRSFDDRVDQTFAPLRGKPAADWIFYAASEGADYSRAWHAISLMMAVVSPTRRRDSLRLAALLAVESVIVNGVIKEIFKRERPPQLDDRAYEVRRPRTKSFPSGHASSAALTAVLLTDAAPRLRPLWLALAATVSASRIHNRMHHGSDVAAGAVIGWGFAAAAKRWLPLR